MLLLVKPVLSMDSLSKNGSAIKDLTGKFVRNMIKTPDYDLNMVIFKNNKEAGEPTDGVYYDVITSDTKVFRTLCPDVAITHADEYSRNVNSMVLVHIDFDILDMDDFQTIENIDAPNDLYFERTNFRVDNINKDKIPAYGFIQKVDINKARLVCGLTIPVNSQ